MLTLKQLQDISNCENILCKDCSAGADCVYNGLETGETSKKIAQTALACIEMLKQIQHSSSDEADNACCPICGSPEGKHAKGCGLWKLIKEE
jgi:formate dehydrogenase maturation protein FdhE